MKRSALLFGFLLLAGCQNEESPSWKPTQPDIATASQKSLINDAVDDIQEFADRQSAGKNFRSIDIRVVRRFSHGLIDNEVSGVCYPGPGSFIELKDWIFQDPEEAWNIVVHELGHCILQRTHDDEVMEADTGPGPVPLILRRGANAYPSNGLTVSVMSTRGNRMAPREYYLRELFGLERIRSLRELRRRYPASVQRAD